MAFDRTDTSLLARWWWTIDRVTWFALMLLLAVGAVMVTAASPPVATRLGLDPFYFVTRQQLFLLLAGGVMFGVSLLSVHQIRRLAVLFFLGTLLLMLFLPVIGFENKGAIRWIRFAGMSLQPSEFMKPCFAVVTAWMFAERHKTVGFPGFRIAFATFVLVGALLIIQPDFGMTATVTAVFGVQFFLAGLPLFWVLLFVALGIMGAGGAYQALPHVKRRIDQFLDPTSGDNYQVEKSLEAFREGGWLGTGPGEGRVKHFIPDSHTDFIFSVVGEEFGLIMSLLIIGLFAFIVLRGLLRLQKENDLFVMIAVAGILGQFALQAIINMGVAVSLLPAKGMTLPFLSYGGSSLIASALGMGMMLALTRKKYGQYRPEG